ncbi:hypothetical protein TRICI_004325 [Trichomonascus ciferrii]|uniref:Transcription factor domain-containing protein n=1 Tax=Trichomonascus ciferrii TaxID=44093 RepID=A0A642V664_9ASCO|nr:hypothetical protein TRICI_004325 [Trichomonascus ciferrii]
MDRFPDRCTRCEKRGQVCQFERGGVTSQSSAPLTHETPKEGSSFLLETRSPGSAPEEAQSNPSSYLIDVPPSKLPFEIDEDQTIYDTTVSREDLRALYVAYFEKFHYLLPVIPKEVVMPTSRPDIANNLGPPVFRRNKPLFWAICLVSCPVVNVDLQQVLLKYVQELVSKGVADNHVIVQQYDTLAIVLALILMSYWYVGTRGIGEDRAFYFSGLALHLGLQVGYNHPTHTNEYHIHPAFYTSAEARGLAWAGICIVNQLSSITYGLLPTLPTDAYYGKIFRVQDPYVSEIKKQILILRQYRTFNKQFVNNLEDELGLTPPESRGLVYNAFDESISSLLTELAPLSAISELMALYCKLHMNLVLLLPDSLERDKKRAIVPVFIISSQVCNVLSRLLDGSDIIPATLPLFVKQQIVVSVIVLYRILSSPYKGLLERESVLNCVSEFYRLSKLIQTPHGKDLQYQKVQNYWGAKFLDAIGVMYSQGALSPELCTVRTRLNASIFVSTAIEMFYWKLETDRLENTKVSAFLRRLQEETNGECLPFPTESTTEQPVQGSDILLDKEDQEFLREIFRFNPDINTLDFFNADLQQPLSS